MAYDARGNTMSESRPGGIAVATQYDGYARLTQYDRTGTASLAFACNGRDDRVIMQLGSDTRRFVYDGAGRVMGEYGNSAADVKAEYVWLAPEVGDGTAFGGGDGLGGYMPLAVATPDLLGTVRLTWVHGNHLGVPLAITDAAGDPVTAAPAYLAPGFPGQSRVLADLYYNRYRDYDPTTGRYIQADPIGLAGGSNVYAYVGGNPVNLVDPMGLEFLDFLDGTRAERALARMMRAQYDRLSPAEQQASLYVAAHGNRTQICSNRHGPCLTPAEFEDELSRRKLLNSEKSITLWACSTGSLDNGFAANLARDTGRTVLAPNGLTWWNSDGMTGIHPRWGNPNAWYGSGKAWWEVGAMRRFTGK